LSGARERATFPIVGRALQVAGAGFRRCDAVSPAVPLALRRGHSTYAFEASDGSVTIHISPKRSTTIPKPLLQKVAWKGNVTWPPSASALKYCSADALSSAVSDRLKPLIGLAAGSQ